MSAIATAALVEEAETHTTCDKCGAAIAKYSDFTGLLPTEDGMRSHTPLVCDRTQELRRAEAERDAQHALVLRLTGERDAANADAVRMLTAASQQAITSARIAADLDESRAQVWGLICAGSNMAERKRYFHGLWETLLDAGLKTDRKISELTATRDLLLTENAQLQQMLSRPDPVVHETPVDGVVPCCGQKLHDLKDGSRVNEGPLVNCDRMRLLSRVGELSSENLLLNKENARLQAQVATLELLRRGGK